MNAVATFQQNIQASDKLVAMYRALRLSRELGARGRLDAANQDLLWLPRSAVVASISALDTYVHSVVNERLPHLFSGNAALPEPLCDELAKLIPIKNASTFRQSVALLKAHDTVHQLLKQLDEKVLRFLSFQAPDKVIEAYNLIGVQGIFDSVSDLWSGPNTTADNIRRRLAGYVQRRNQIAHEGDLEGNGQQRAMQPEYAVQCREFVGNLVVRLNQVVYGA
jgi:hypothetical protein